MGDNKIALYTLFNDNYFECGSNMIYSFIQNNPWFVDCSGIIVILNDNKYCILNDINKKRLALIYKNIEYLDIDYLEYKKIFDNQIGLSDESVWCCFYKLEIFKQGKYNRKVYLDSDIIIQSDIRELWYTKSYFSACLDYPIKQSGESLRRSENAFYFNGGLYCVNEDYNPNFTFDEVFNFCACVNKIETQTNIRSKNKGKAVDQDYLNMFITDDNVTLLPNMVYNYCCGFGINDVKKLK